MFIWCLVAEIWLRTNWWVIFGKFLPFNPAGGLKIKVFKNKKITILTFYTRVPKKLFVCRVRLRTNTHGQKHVIFGNFFPFTVPRKSTIEIFKKQKNLLEILWFYISVPEIMIIRDLIIQIWLRPNSQNILG